MIEDCRPEEATALDCDWKGGMLLEFVNILCTFNPINA